MFPGGGQVPGLGAAVAPVGRVAAVEMSHDGDGAGVRRLIAAVLIATLRAAGRIGPVQRLVHGEQMRSEVAARLDEAVDPLDAHGPAPVGLDRERGVVERAGVVHRSVTPDRCRPQPHAVRQDPLPELPYRDLVVVDRCRPPGAAIASAGHGRRDHERGDVLRDRARIEDPASGRHRKRPAALEAPDQQPHARAGAVLDEPPPAHPVCRAVGGNRSMV